VEVEEGREGVGMFGDNLMKESKWYIFWFVGK
jgi:hypothetical protein